MGEPDRSQFLISRSRMPTDEAARFVENRITISNQPNTIYSERSGNFVTLQEGKREEQISAEMWKQADTEKEELFDLMEQVRIKFDDKDGYRLGNLRHCKWDQVMQEVQETALRWKNSPRRASRVMQYIDKLGRNSEAFQSWLELLPAGDYGSSIAGVFTIAIGAASRYNKVEDAILQALADIPEILENSRRYVKIYANLRDHFLEKRTFDLFRSILRTLSHIMRFFNESTFRKISGSILKQATYKDDLTASLEAVRSHSVKIQEEASQCLAWRLLGQENMLLKADQKSDQGLHLLQSIYQLLRTSPFMGTNNGGYTAVNDVPGSSLAYQNLAALAARPMDGPSETNPHVSYLPANSNCDKARKSFARESSQELLKLLHYNSQIVSDNVDTCLRLGEALNEGAKAQAAAMIQHPKFREFMAEYLASSSLVVNGRADLSSTEGLSPLSFVAAKLARVSEETNLPSESAYVVKYFCDQHRPFAHESDVSPPIAMMASLVGQLLTQMMERDLVVDLSMLKQSDWQKVEKLNLRTLNDIFIKLTYQLPTGGVLLCIIDEVSQYEISPLIKETDAIIKRLARLVSKHDGLVFKLLVTCQGRAEVSKYFANHTMDLDPEVEPDDLSSWMISTIKA
ncbi:hypothetical protein F5Y19DRAFT_425982 [Xylariaceae sp. FL1651]|nr:hypothetical protein F5Y19DRAFT_425982 [Xylariaceae sp. FL1651]